MSMATNTSASVAHPASIPAKLTRSQCQFLNSGWRLLARPVGVCSRTSFCGAHVYLNAAVRYGWNEATNRIVDGVATKSFPDKMEESGVTLAEKRETNNVGRDAVAGEEIGLSKPTVNEHGIRQLRQSVVPLGSLKEHECESLSVKDYLDRAPDLIRPDGGPPRWYCPVECSSPPKDAPVLLYLSGIDGTGLGLILQHRTLGELFEVRCLHIPVMDRTPFEGLVKYVEDTIKFEHAFSPMKPIYLVGDSFGGCLALAVAAHNPMIDLVLILVNPATSFKKSQLQPFFPLLEAMPKEYSRTVPYLLSFIMGDPIRMAMADIKQGLPPLEMVNQLRETLMSYWPRLSVLADILPKETLLWKLKLLKSASSYAKSRLHAVKAEVLVLASEKDQMLPSHIEAMNLLKSLPNCRIRYFRDSGHALLLEGGINLATSIKGANLYRHSKTCDYMLDFVPPTPQEFRETYDGQFGWLRQATSPVMFSTLEDGKIVEGLTGIPTDGPVLLVGYHMLMGLEVTPLVGEIFRQRNILVRGVAHPFLFAKNSDKIMQQPNPIDSVRLFGAVPVSARSFFRLLSTKSFVLLYPGGAREALHRKGEQYKLFWPERAEFVRMAARFGTTIIPFGVVGEDDIAEMLLDYDDLKEIPYIKGLIEQLNEGVQDLGINMEWERSQPELHIPGVVPKIPGRIYYLFRKPIFTEGRREELKDKEAAHALYLHIKSEVAAAISYLQKKREEDPYRGILPRFLYEATWGFKRQAPTFKP